MFKRMALTLAFLATFATVGLSVPSSAQAWRYWGGGPYRSYYYGPPRAYYGTYYARPYRTYYYGPPRVYAPSYAYGPGYYYAGPGVSVGVGF